MSTTVLTDADPFEPRFARHASGLLRAFNQAAVISAADVHVARRLGAIAEETDEQALLAVALAVRGPRLGHVHVDLSRIRQTAAVDAEEPVDLEALDWPDPEPWIAGLARSRLVAVGDDASEPARPLRLVGEWLYLDRYWAEEVAVAQALEARSARPVDAVDLELLADGLRRLFGDEPAGRQSLAAATAVRRRFMVVAGGPGTGKTTTVARIVALLGEQALATGDRLPLVALAAPTGKAAARLEAAVHEQARGLPVAPAIGEALLELPATTLHRLLGWRPDSASRFRHDRRRRLPHDVVIVDETSMVSLSLMARLIEALRDDARLILVGDPGQLASIEAGAVLGDIVGPAADEPRRSEPGPAPTAIAGSGSGARAGIREAIVVLEHGHRFGAGIGGLATAIRSGDDDAVIGQLAAGPAGIRWIQADVATDSDLRPVRRRCCPARWP